MRMNHRSTSEDRRRQALDSSAPFMIQRVYYKQRGTRDYTKGYDAKVQSPHRVFIGRYLELTIRLVSHGSFQHGCGFSGIQHLVESYHSFSASQGAQGEVEDASLPGDEASRRKSVTAEQESICISSGQFSTVPVTTKSHIVGISGLNIYRAVIINRWSGPVSAAASSLKTGPLSFQLLHAPDQLLQ
ncbi:hypothetical protein T03_14886 [Trichinella britovi]|uniref:Uncharacterized protein n=1 Tax=Trichinella britovi TaxID=45882 RepID=A0A0V1DCA9_TRIBR|nr:hypothetical protein T03_14886 [Trichinella britovi]